MMNNWVSCVIEHSFPKILITQISGLIQKNDNNPDQELYRCEFSVFSSYTQTAAFDCTGLIRSV